MLTVREMAAVSWIQSPSHPEPLRTLWTVTRYKRTDLTWTSGEGGGGGGGSGAKGLVLTNQTLSHLNILYRHICILHTLYILHTVKIV